MRNIKNKENYLEGAILIDPTIQEINSTPTFNLNDPIIFISIILIIGILFVHKSK